MNLPGFFELTPEQRARWEKVRTGGRRRFVLIWGVLVFGVGLYILSDLLWYVLNPQGNQYIPEQRRLGIEVLVFIVHLIIGALFALLVWWHTEREYLKYPDRNRPTRSRA
jgi:hypothetical protein